MKKNIKMLFLTSLVFTACAKIESDITPTTLDQPLTAGSANFSKFVSLGNSLTSGFSDGTLFKQGQQNCFPKILADQFALVGGGAFTIPYMNDNIGGLTFGGTVIVGPRLYFNGTGPAPVSGTPTTEVLTTLTGPFNNMGVPGAKSFHMLAAGYGNAAGVPTGAANPYFVRFRTSATATMLGDAVAQNPTFFSLWAGNNDVLSYATSGGIGIDQTGNTASPATYGGNDITDPTTFAGVYNALINGLTAGGAKGVVANIPNVTSVPYFTTVPTNALPGLPATSVTQLNQLFGGINAALAASGLPPRFVTLVADDGNPATIEKNPLLIVDDNPSPTYPNISVQITAALTPTLGVATATFLGNLYGKARHAKNDNPATAQDEQDYIVLTARTIIGTTQTGAPAPFNIVGVSYPMQDNTTLTAYESGLVKNATSAFNNTIKSIAMAKGLAFVDANSILNQVATAGGYSFGSNYVVTSQYVTGGGFSMDGVHPSPRGYALIANKFFEAINLTYGSNFRPVDLGKYQIQYPAVLPN